jgi:hypothetical protein
MANIWRDPIFDRTSHDVSFAIQQISAWKKSHSHVGDVNIYTDNLTLNAEGEVSASEDAVVLNTKGNVAVEDNVLVVKLGVVHDLKGCLNLSDLTRIEDNIAYLSEILTRYQYPIVTNSKVWAKESLPNAEDMKRIAANIRSMFSGYYTPHNAETIPEVMLSYKDINAIERNLFLLREILDAMQSLFIKSGTYKCGAKYRLPIRR